MRQQSENFLPDVWQTICICFKRCCNLRQVHLANGFRSGMLCLLDLSLGFVTPFYVSYKCRMKDTSTALSISRLFHKGWGVKEPLFLKFWCDPCRAQAYIVDSAIFSSVRQVTLPVWRQGGFHRVVSTWTVCTLPVCKCHQIFDIATFGWCTEEWKQNLDRRGNLQGQVLWFDTLICFVLGIYSAALYFHCQGCHPWSKLTESWLSERSEHFGWHYQSKRDRQSWKGKVVIDARRLHHILCTYNIHIYSNHITNRLTKR